MENEKQAIPPTETLAPDDKKMVVYEADRGGEISLNMTTVRKYLVSGRRDLVTDEEVVLFMHLCKARRVNPWIKEAWLIKYTERDPAGFIYSIHYLRDQANKNPRCPGWTRGIVVWTDEGGVSRREGSGILYPGEKLLGGYFESRPVDWRTPYKLEVCLEAHIKTTAKGQLTKFWLKPKQPAQIMKVAESQGLSALYINGADDEIDPGAGADPDEIDPGDLVDAEFIEASDFDKFLTGQKTPQGTFNIKDREKFTEFLMFKADSLGITLDNFKSIVDDYVALIDEYLLWQRRGSLADPGVKAQEAPPVETNAEDLIKSFNDKSAGVFSVEDLPGFDDWVEIQAKLQNITLNQYKVEWADSIETPIAEFKRIREEAAKNQSGGMTVEALDKVAHFDAQVVRTIVSGRDRSDFIEFCIRRAEADHLSLQDYKVAWTDDFDRLGVMFNDSQAPSKAQDGLEDPPGSEETLQAKEAAEAPLNPWDPPGKWNLLRSGYKDYVETWVYDKIYPLAGEDIKLQKEVRAKWDRQVPAAPFPSAPAVQETAQEAQGALKDPPGSNDEGRADHAGSADNKPAGNGVIDSADKSQVDESKIIAAFNNKVREMIPAERIPAFDSWIQDEARRLNMEYFDFKIWHYEGGHVPGLVKSFNEYKEGVGVIL